MTPGENADWSWDEHVLTLDLYLRFPTKTPGKKSQPVLELSAFLNRLGERMGVMRTPKFRNANGVYMKLMNFKSVDPAVQAKGKAGLNRGSSLEKRVWAAYADDPASLRARVAAVRLAIQDVTVSLVGATEEEDFEGEEGGLVLRLHYSRERRPGLARKKKEQVRRSQGRLACEVCAFDFSARYGDHGEGYIEAHHRKPVSALVEGEKTKVSDLALVCANCHRMLHKRGLLSIEALKAMLAPA
jgi:5-methylcytosine-specific restriction protein A